MKRTVSYPIYAAAFAISLAIFVIGIYIGMQIDQANVRSISDDVSNISEKVASIQLLLLAEGNSSSFCPVYASQLDSIDQDVERIGYKLAYLEDEKGVFDSELKKKYFIMEAESYLLSQKVKALCGDDSILVINFYSNAGCGRCREQGIEILKARDALAAQGIGAKLFSFDGEIGSPVAEAFARQYNVTGYPSVVINGRAYSGFRDSESLQAYMKAAR
ncbi:hypothetical protein L0Y65_00145 [Candidatus Micrarchaeota archaeon]|nr:hypothetical protein [Candidatus Micrarchaeota archaeon]